MARQPSWGRQRTHVGRLEEFKVGEFRHVQVQGREVSVLRSVDGHFYAVRNYCPHRGAPVCRGRLGGTMLPSAPGDLVYGLRGRIVQCPHHHWEFDLATGKAVDGFTRQRLVVYDVEVADDDVYVSPRIRPSDEPAV